jgi:hypothetical protein
MWTSWRWWVWTGDFFALHWYVILKVYQFKTHSFQYLIETNRCRQMYWKSEKKNSQNINYHSPSKNSPPKKITSPTFNGFDIKVPLIRGGILEQASSWMATFAAS